MLALEKSALITGGPLAEEELYHIIANLYYICSNLPRPRAVHSLVSLLSEFLYILVYHAAYILVLSEIFPSVDLGDRDYGVDVSG